MTTAPGADDGPQAQIAIVRDFNRRYTRTIGVLDQHLLASPFSLTEARVLYELAHRDAATATEIGADLALDLGYLSRILRNFTTQKLVMRSASAADRRQYSLTLTAKGMAAYARLDAASHRATAEMLARLAPDDRARLIAAMHTITGVLAGDATAAPRVTLRPHGPGDMGWVVQRNGAYYAEAFGWDSSYEALAAEIVAQFLKTFDAARERCWIAERDGERVGAVFLVRQSDTVAKLRLLLVDPAGRGLGLGKRLVGECIAFARACGYRRITLWTQSILTTARGIYAAAGFVHVATEPHRSFGQDLIGETWELDLTAQSADRRAQ
jgi:DNA-binding MarR family transcriptional regulator/N-acetylglutamate synthase-like GNAT family acetyltransferase